jgi:hypothetical protein
MATPRAGDDEEELGELPPLDGDSDDSGDAANPLEGSLEMPPEDGDSDSEITRDPTAEDGDLLIRDDGVTWLNEEPDASDLEIGPGTLLELGTDAFASDDDVAGKFEDDAELWEEPAQAALDGGAEGPLAADEELRDEDLPALDADDDGEGADAAFVDATFASDEPLGVAWASNPWPRVGAPLRLTGATSIACAGRCVLVALRADERDGVVKRPSELVQVDLEGACTTLNAAGFDGPDVEALANDGTDNGMVAMVLRGGGLLTSADGGAQFTKEDTGISAADCIVAQGRVWVRTQGGSLVASGSSGFERCSLPGSVSAIARDSSSAVALMAPDDAGRRAIARFARDASIVLDPIVDEGETSAARGRPEPRRPAGLPGTAGHVAYCARAGIVRRGGDGRWRPYTGWEGYVTAMAFVDDNGTLLVAAYSEVEDMTGLIRIDASGGLSVVARVGALRDQGESDGRVLSLVCDDARGVVWLAGGFGVAAFSMGVD